MRSYFSNLFIPIYLIVRGDTQIPNILLSYFGEISFWFRETFIGNPFFRFCHHFGGDVEIITGIVVDVEFSGFEEAPLLEEVGQVGFGDVAAGFDEFELVLDGVVSAVVSCVVAEVFHHVGVEAGMSVFGKVQVKLPQGDQLIEKVL